MSAIALATNPVVATVLSPPCTRSPSGASDPATDGYVRLAAVGARVVPVKVGLAIGALADISIDDEADRLLINPLTKAVVAMLLLISLLSGVGAVGVPVSDGLLIGALRFIAASCTEALALHAAVDVAIAPVT